MRLANGFPVHPRTAHSSTNCGNPCILCCLGSSRTFPCQTSLLGAETRKRETVQCATPCRTSPLCVLEIHWQQPTSIFPRTKTVHHQLHPKEQYSFPSPLCADSNSPRQVQPPPHTSNFPSV